MATKKEKIKRLVPSFFSPNNNPYIKALLEAHGDEDDKIVAQLLEAKNQLFVTEAEQEYLDQLGNNVLVYRPLEVNLSDANFRKLIPYLSFHSKQIRSLIIKILDLFYTPIFSRYNVQTQNQGPYALTGGESLVWKTENSSIKNIVRQLQVNGGVDGFGTLRVTNTAGAYIGQTVNISDDDSLTITATITNVANQIITTNKDTSAFTTDKNAIVFYDTYDYTLFNQSDFQIPGVATVDEVVDAINTENDTSIASSANSDTEVNLRTKTAGTTGYIQILGGSANLVLNFPIDRGKQLRIQVSEVNSNEIVIRIPSTIPALRRTLKGSHHFHETSALVSGWPGSFMYDTTVDYSITSISTTLNQSIIKGQVYTELVVVDSSSFPDTTGYFMLNFGNESMEYPIQIIGRPNNSTLLIDPTYIFHDSHSSGESVNLIEIEPTIPKENGDDYAVYLVGIEAAREQVQEIIRSVVGTGVTIRWVIDTPICGI